MAYITHQRFERVVSLPVAVAQTELRRAKTIACASWTLANHQQLVLRLLNLHVIKALTPGQLPVYANAGLGAVSVGLYLGSELNSPIAWASVPSVGTAAINPFAPVRIIGPGLYTVIVSNNTENLDFAVAVSGSLRLYA